MKGGQRELDVTEMAIAVLHLAAASFAKGSPRTRAKPWIQGTVLGDGSRGAIADVINMPVGDLDDRLSDDILGRSINLVESAPGVVFVYFSSFPAGVDSRNVQEAEAQSRDSFRHDITKLGFCQGGIFHVGVHLDKHLT